jgi:pilus assembly protein Flp/PilA
MRRRAVPFRNDLGESSGRSEKLANVLWFKRRRLQFRKSPLSASGSQERGMARVRNFLSNESGATAIEYGLICALVFLVAVGSIQTFATKTTNMYNNIAAKL